MRRGTISLRLPREDWKKIRRILLGDSNFARIIRIVFTLDYVRGEYNLRTIRITTASISEVYKCCYGGQLRDLDSLVRQYLRGKRMPQDLIRILRRNMNCDHVSINLFIRTIKKKNKNIFIPNSIRVIIADSSETINLNKLLVDEAVMACLYPLLDTSMFVDALEADKILIAKLGVGNWRMLIRERSYIQARRGIIGWAKYIDRLIELLKGRSYSQEKIRERVDVFIRLLEKVRATLRDFRRRKDVSEALDFLTYKALEIINEISKESPTPHITKLERLLLGLSYPPFTLLCLFILKIFDGNLTLKIDLLESLVKALANIAKKIRKRNIVIRAKKLIKILKSITTDGFQEGIFDRLLFLYGGKPGRNQIDDDPGRVLWFTVLATDLINNCNVSKLPENIDNYLRRESAERILRQHYTLLSFVCYLEKKARSLLTDKANISVILRYIEHAKRIEIERIIVCLLVARANNIAVDVPTRIENIAKQTSPELYETIRTLTKNKNEEDLYNLMSSLARSKNRRKRSFKYLIKKRQKTLEALLSILHSRILISKRLWQRE